MLIVSDIDEEYGEDGWMLAVSEAAKNEFMEWKGADAGGDEAAGDGASAEDGEAGGGDAAHLVLLEALPDGDPLPMPAGCASLVLSRH